ncbi:MAG: glycosyltransferase family A protein [Edaphobacter sp.]|uniref:glycosyltransferase family 2 protein n=1 Tax=Edaphobacter sp. TaxID=1934404 RepID=UPI00239394D7|nr:glycosyltransferase family A protein [Edaphobacter sp.]MDE1177257.1 glycosyltransferase family A protein [Edaphobacter sp.]
MAVFEAESLGAGSVTVIIPAYNAERFIRRSIDSALKQTYAVSQIIVIDDGSKDATRQILSEEFAGRVTLIEQQNGGPAKARNAGLRIATGEYIAFLDADDWWELDKIAEQLRVLSASPQAIGNYTGLRVVSETEELLADLDPVVPSNLNETFRWCNPGVPPSSVLLRRSALEKLDHGYDERLRGSEDWNLWFRLIKFGSFCICPEPLTDYVSSAGGLSGDADHMFGDFMKMLDDTLLAGQSGLRRAIWRRRILSYQAFKACLTARAAGNKVAERSYMMRSIAEWPSPFWASERFRYFAVTAMRT